MRKCVYIALGLLASLGLLLGLTACLGQQQVCNESMAEMAVIRGIDYLPGNKVPGYNITGTPLTGVDLGPVYDTINGGFSGCTAPPTGNYSTYLADGTKLYTIKGYQPWFRLAFKETGSSQAIGLIEAISNPHASKGSALMQLDGKVESILLYAQSSPSSSPTTPPLKTVKSSQQVAQLIALFDQAPVQSKADTGSTFDQLVFRFHDGTVSSLVYDPTSGWTNRGVWLPSSFATLL